MTHQVVLINRDPVLSPEEIYALQSLCGYNAFEACRVDDAEFGPESALFRKIGVFLVVRHPANCELDDEVKAKIGEGPYLIVDLYHTKEAQRVVCANLYPNGYELIPIL